VKSKTFLQLIFLFVAAPLFAQSNFKDSVNKVKWLKENAIKAVSIDPTETNFADLEPLKKWIGNAQVVSIGEPAHQIGTVMQAKTRLVEFLHQNMGFDLVAIESGIYNVDKVWKHIQSGNNSFEAYKRNIFFSSFLEYAPLFNYINSKVHSSQPLELAGFDPQLTGKFSRDSLLPDLRNFFSGIGFKSTQLEDSSLFAKELTLLNDYKVNNADLVLKELSFLSKVLDSLAPTPLNRDGRFYKQVLESTKKYTEDVLLNKSMQLLTGSDYACAASLHLTIRDRQMADNLLWHLRQNPKRKIIVMAHNSHLIKDYPGNRERQRWTDSPDAPLAPKGLCEETYMGYIIADSLKEKLFNISFTIGEGTVGYVYLKDSTRNFTWYVPKSSKPEVLENYLDAAGFENAIVNLKQPGKGGEWLKDFIRIRYYTGPGNKYQWSKAADAIFYVRKATPLHQE
jgi:erythromycin esterase